MSIKVSKLDLIKSRSESIQFVFGLARQTLLPIDIAAPVCGKSVSGFRVDVTRRPSSLPKLTRIGARVFVRVADLLDFINPHTQHADPASAPATRRPGRPTKVEQLGGR